MGEEATQVSEDLSSEQMDHYIDDAGVGVNNTNRDSEPIDDGIQVTAPAYERTLKVNGQEIKVDSEDKMLQWAQQGHDYGQKMQDFNKDKAAFDEKNSLYQDIDNYASENPEWWDHVQSSFNNKDASQLTQSGVDQEKPTEENPAFAELRSEMDELREFKSDILAEREAGKRDSEDKALDAEINGIKENYSDINWNDANDKGQNLETQILEHARENGINSFKTAFRDYYHENLIAKSQMQTKEKFMGEIQRQKQLGILGETPSPVKNGLTVPTDIKNQSYDSLVNDALREYGIE